MQGKTIAVAIAVIVVLGAAYYLWAMPAQAPEATTNQQTPATSEPVRDPMMSGTWRSDRDAKFTREMRADGAVIDRYEGENSAGVNGQWEVVDPAQEATLLSRAAALSGMTVVRVTWENGIEVTYFAVNKLEEKSMTTTDLTGRGEVTIWTKI